MFCRGDVMSRFVILEALERSGTGASKGFPFDSFPDPAQIPGHSRATTGKIAGFPPRSGYYKSCLSKLQQLSVCLPIRPRGKFHQERNLIGKQARCREADSTMSPLSDDSDPDPLSLFPPQIPRKH